VKKVFFSSNFVLNTWLSNKEMVVMSIDTRGTGFRGQQWMKQVYKKLGILEANDTIEIAKYMKKEHPWVDKVIVWGWSYGGYVSLLSALQSTDVIDLAIVGAPITHWTFYDTAYTEKFMLLPEMNKLGYKESSCLNKIHRNITSRLFLITGTADDNVHPLNAYHLMTTLQRNLVLQFTSMIYPDMDHSIIRGSTHKLTMEHLYRSILKQITDLTNQIFP